MKKIMNKWRKAMLNESSLSRVYHHMTEHETAILTGHRDDPLELSMCQGQYVSYSEDYSEFNTALQINKKRNRDIKAVLLADGYGVTVVNGTYVENYRTPEQIEKDKAEGKQAPETIEVKEGSLFVVNLIDSPSFFDTIIALGKKFCQDSVLVIPIGGESASLYGTNHSQWPGLDQTIELGNLFMGKEAEFMTRVSNRPFTFGEGLETYKTLSRNERMAVKSIAKNYVLTNG
jgi:hypothetical protein